MAPRLAHKKVSEGSLAVCASMVRAMTLLYDHCWCQPVLLSWVCISSRGYRPPLHVSVTHYDTDRADTRRLLLKGLNILPTHYIPQQRAYSP
jgi:hypothetical protein